MDGRTGDLPLDHVEGFELMAVQGVCILRYMSGIRA